jgi:hypothetical protein
LIPCCLIAHKFIHLCNTNDHIFPTLFSICTPVLRFVISWQLEAIACDYLCEWLQDDIKIYMILHFYLSCTCSIWASKWHWLDNFLLFTVTDRNIVFSVTPVTYYLLSFWNLDVNPVHFLLTENIKRDNQAIFLQFKI